MVWIGRFGLTGFVDLVCFCLFEVLIYTGCPKKKGISECFSFSFLIRLEIEINAFVPSKKPFLSDIRELSYKCFKYQILLASFQLSSMIKI